MNKSSGRVLVLVAALLFFGVLVCPAQTNPSPQESAAQSASQKPKSNPYTLDDVLRFVGDINDGVASEKEVMKKLQRGVSFNANDENIEQLVKKGASKDLIDEIRTLAKEAEPKFTLTITCAPAECEIKIKDKPVGATTNGTLVIPDLPAGEVFVNFDKDGYMGDQQPVKIGAESASSVHADLKPTDETKLKNGKKLYDMMLAALGGKTPLKALRSLTAKDGSMTSYKDGKPSRWNFEVAMAPPRLIEMKVSNSAGSFVFRCNGETCAKEKKAFLGRKQLPDAVTGDLESNLHLLSQYDLVTLLEAINAPKVRLTAQTADGTGKAEQHLRADTPIETYDLTIGTDFLPTTVDLQPRIGIGAVKIAYGTYGKVGDYEYPSQTSIGSSGSASSSGIEVRLSHVTLGSNVKLSDFPK